MSKTRSTIHHLVYAIMGAIVLFHLGFFLTEYLTDLLNIGGLEVSVYFLLIVAPLTVVGGTILGAKLSIYILKFNQSFWLTILIALFIILVAGIFVYLWVPVRAIFPDFLALWLAPGFVAFILFLLFTLVRRLIKK